MLAHIPRLIILATVCAACAGDDPAASRDAGQSEADTRPQQDADAGDSQATSRDTDATAPSSPWLAARDYCETVATMYCDYYLRCGRMAVDDAATCIAVFDEVCDLNYEPIYARLEAAGQLRLSRAGVAACEAHLASVACDRQLGDLDGGCDQMWQGQVASGGACGPGIESLICDEDSACVLGLEAGFCGTCQQAAGIGAPCGGDLRCRSTARCIGGVCVARGLPGDACGDDTPCVIGARCEAGSCVRYEVVAVGMACDPIRRCPYKARCVGGVCVETALQGEACGEAAPCASGVCDGGRCEVATPPESSCL